MTNLIENIQNKNILGFNEYMTTISEAEKADVIFLIISKLSGDLETLLAFLKLSLELYKIPVQPIDFEIFFDAVVHRYQVDNMIHRIDSMRCQKNDAKVLKIFKIMSQKYDLDTQDHLGMSPLLYACKYRAVHLVEYLAARKVAFDLMNDEKQDWVDIILHGMESECINENVYNIILTMTRKSGDPDIYHNLKRIFDSLIDSLSDCKKNFKTSANCCSSGASCFEVKKYIIKFIMNEIYSDCCSYHD
jgi:ankyrin repeat protein